MSMKPPPELAAETTDRLTVEIFVNNQPNQVVPGTTLAGLVAELGLQPRYLAIELNGQLVPRAHHATTSVEAGDRLEIVTLVGGG